MVNRVALACLIFCGIVTVALLISRVRRSLTSYSSAPVGVFVDPDGGCCGIIPFDAGTEP